MSDRIRVIANASKFKPASLNDLVYSPRFLSFHLQGSHFRDLLFLSGPGAQLNAIDQCDAFRSDQLDKKDYHLFVYKLEDEWYFDLRHPFGWVPSEWSYHSIVSVLKFSLPDHGVAPDDSSSLHGYVDNWFLFSRGGDASHNVRWATLKGLFDQLGISMHEEQKSCDQVVNALGWDWDTDSRLMICPTDKHEVCVSRLSGWHAKALADQPFSSEEIERLVGLMQWISSACPVAVPYVASLRAVTLRFTSTAPRSHCTIKLSAEAKECVAFLHGFFAQWDRKQPLFAGFSPICAWQYLIRCDASTLFGAGGFILPSRRSYIHAWSEEERQLALSHSTDPDRESTTVFELLGLLLFLGFLGEVLRGKRVQIELDSEPAVRCLLRGFSVTPACLLLVRKIRDHCARLCIIPRFEHILSSLNSIADHLSHNDFDQANERAKVELSLPLMSPFYHV